MFHAQSPGSEFVIECDAAWIEELDDSCAASRPHPEEISQPIAVHAHHDLRIE